MRDPNDMTTLDRWDLFHPTNIQVLMGGDFNLGRPKTVKELLEHLDAIRAEIASWGEDTAISELAIVKDKIQITLENGIPQ